MDCKRIIDLAYNGALNIWANEKQYLEKMPDNLLCQLREKNAWDELQEIRSLGLKCEKNSCENCHIFGLK